MNHKRDREATVDRLLARAMPGAPAESAGACLDADTLAAWADDALDAGARAAAEAHASNCARCQAMLAAMAKTAPTPAPTQAFPWRVPSLRWLVPLTAAAAAVLLWVVVPRESGPVNVRQVSQVAESTPQPPSPPPPSREATDSVAPSSAPVVSGRARRDQETPREKDIAADKKAATAADANALADAPTRNAEARLDKAQASPESAAAAAPASPPSAQTAQTARTFSFAAPETFIVSSNPASRWRILQGGAVQRSSDGGATWQMQTTGVTETLSAGASPSPSVCWLVGPNGIVLLSTDGRSWRRVPFPEVVQIVSIRATDDQAATVTTADGRQFVTDDGGRMWTKVP